MLPMIWGRRKANVSTSVWTGWFLLLLQLMLLISWFLLRQHFSFLPCVSAPASIGDWLQCIRNEECIQLYLVVMLFQIIRPCHICNGSFSPENMLEHRFCSAVTPLKTNEKCLCLYCVSLLQVNRKVNYNFRGKWLDWHQICLVNCCKGHAKEGLKMSNTRLWSLSLCKIWWIDIVFQTLKMSVLIFWCFCSSDNGNWALMDICETH